MTEIVEKKHAVLSPSGWSRWSACPGSVELEKPFPQSSSKYARYGTAGHELADLCLQKREDAENWVGETFVVEGDEILVDMAMADLVNEYVSYVETFLDRDNGDKIHSEQRVPLAHLTGEKDAEGTSDVIGIANGGKRLVVIDLKTGAGVPVFASTMKDRSLDKPLRFDPVTMEINGQLAMYGSGALRNFDPLYDFEEVQLVIIQPPLKIVDHVTMTIAQLRSFEEQVSIAAGRTQIGDAELVPGDKQCKFCRAKSTCPALRDEVLSVMTNQGKSEFRNLDAEPAAMPKMLAAAVVTPDDGNALAAAMRSASLVETWLKGVRAEVERRLFDGQRVPGFKIVQGKKGNRQWGDETAALELMKKSTGVKIDDVAPRKVVSPSAAEKLFKGQEKRWSRIAPLITQSEGGPSVAPESDPRPEYAVVSTAQSFAVVTAENALTDTSSAATPDLAALLS